MSHYEIQWTERNGNAHVDRTVYEAEAVQKFADRLVSIDRNCNYGLLVKLVKVIGNTRVELASVGVGGCRTTAW